MRTGRPRILLVEDIDFNRDLVAQILQDDYDVIEAVDGLEGVRLAQTERPDVILMDLSLPGIDGWEATRRIKEDAALAATPVIALTAHAMAGDRERAMAAGCDDFLTKPLDDALLLRRVREWAERGGRATASDPPAPDAGATRRAEPTGPATPGDVLVVDDAPDNRAQLDEELSSEGFRVRLASTGADALAAAVESPPDVVVLDVKMPDLDGVEVCRRLREHPATTDVMIVFCSAIAGAAQISRALDAGGNDYVTRPYAAVELVARVRAAVRMKREKQALRRHIRDVAQSVARAQGRLAQVWDRGYLFERLDEEARRAAEHHGRAIASILFAIDSPEAIRRDHGAAGLDLAVRELAAMLLDHVRPEDVVSHYGEHEFLVLLTDVALDDARRLAERIRDAAQARSFAEGTIRLTTSSGVAWFDKGTPSASTRVVRAADAALYLARRDGTAQVRVYQG